MLFTSIGGELSEPYAGELDDVQIYSGVLSAAEIAYLYRTPGATAPNAGLNFNTALQTTNLTWTTSGDTTWTIESTNTVNQEPFAAESGMVTNEQSSTLSGPASLTFFWSAQGSEFSDFDYEVYLDGDPYNNDLDDLYTAAPWAQEGPFLIPSGQHTVSWSTFANGDNDPTELGFLDHVVITPAAARIQNPAIVNGQFQFQFSGTTGINYSLYSTTNLASGDWIFLGNYPGGYTFTPRFPLSAAQQFYTVRAQ